MTVVVGGGIVGLASAYYLADAGVEVTVLEKSSIGAGSTDRAAGGIRAQFSTPVSIALSQRSIEVWERFEETFGVDIEYRRPGYMYLARRPETVERFRRTVEVQNEHGVTSEVLSPAEATEYCPELAADRYVGATYNPTDGFADPHLALQGFSVGAREAGAEVRTGVGVTDVVCDASGRVAGVETTEGRVDADYVVNAAGAWAPRVAAMAGIDLEVVPRRRQALVVDPELPVPDSVPFTTDIDLGCYFRPEREGTALVGGHVRDVDPAADPDAYDTDTDLDWREAVLERAGDCAGYFGPETRIERGWAGLYAVTPDHHPIIEETVPGFVNAVGFSGHGFMQSPATGQLVAELVVEGEPSLVDVSPLSSDRFERGEPLHETYYSA